jgi:hypothetical protein
MLAPEVQDTCIYPGANGVNRLQPHGLKQIRKEWCLGPLTGRPYILLATLGTGPSPAGATRSVSNHMHSMSWSNIPDNLFSQQCFCPSRKTQHMKEEFFILSEMVGKFT